MKRKVIVNRFTKIKLVQTSLRIIKIKEKVKINYKAKLKVIIDTKFN